MMYTLTHFLGARTGKIEGINMKQSRSILTICVSVVALPLEARIESFSSLMRKSEMFNAATAFPTSDNRIAIIAGSDKHKKRAIRDEANSVRPIAHPAVEGLIKSFLKHKGIFGSAVERRLYARMSVGAFIDRLLIKRPLMFMTASDSYLLRNGLMGDGGFEAIGTMQESAPLLLRDYLSYDEMQIAALLGVSVPTFFINDGNRTNRSVPGSPGSFQESGVYVGLVGARFEKPGYMEWQHMMVTPQQNTASNGYGVQADQESAQARAIKMWESFYGETFPTYAQAQADTSGRYVLVGLGVYLDTMVYKKRMRMVIEPFLRDANERGKEYKQKVYCHAVGLGLGVWQKSPVQAHLMLDVYKDIVQEVALPYIADIDFSWFPAGTSLQHDQSVNPDLTFHFSKRNPADKLAGQDAQKLLVAQYAWDGNAYPGNEYWAGYLTASGDPAAACCSTIAELQNPLINSNASAQKMVYYK